MKLTIITAFDEENRDYIADIQELDYFGHGETELEAIKDAARIIIEHAKSK